MNDIPPAPSPGTKAAAWAGGVLYVLAIGLLIGAAPRASGTVQGVGALLAATLLVGTLRRAPLLTLILVLLGSAAVVAGRPSAADVDLSPSYQGQFLAFLAVDLVLAHLVATRARRTAAIAVAASLVIQLLLVAGFTSGDGMTVNVVIALLAMAAGCSAGLLVTERREHAVALRSQEVAEAVVAERLRIARELHDMVAHSISIIAIQAGVGSRVIRTQPDEALAALRAIETTGRETLSGLRRTLVALRQADPDTEPSGRAPLTPTPGLADLDRLAAATADAGVRVDLRRSGEQRPLPTDIDLSAYRLVQEALTNVVRHAGTRDCRVLVEYGDGELSVDIVDDGRGAGGDGASRHGFGLVGMRERVALLNGHISAGPRPEGGFRVVARLPLGEPVEASAQTR